MVKAVIFTDFDGTVTLEDSNDYLTDTLGFGKEKRLKVFEGVLDDTKTFRQGFMEMLESIHTPFPECIKILEKKIRLDPGFKDTFEWAQENDVPVIVVSSGMKPIIKVLLTRLVGQELFTKLTLFPMKWKSMHMINGKSSIRMKVPSDMTNPEVSMLIKRNLNLP